MTMNKKLTFILTALAAVCLLAVTGGAARAEDAQWRARFWNNKAQSGDPVAVRNDNTIDFDWGQGSPAAGVNNDNFSAQWTRRVNFQPGTYRFTATMDDGMRVYFDNNIIIDSWTDSQEHTMTRDLYVNGGEHDLKVDYFDAGGAAVARVSWQLIQPAGETGGGGGQFFPNWKAEYYNNTSLSGAPALVRDDRYLNHNWGTGSPAPGTIGTDFFSARWTKTLSGDPGTYSIILTSDDGARLYINNQLVIDNWGVQAPTTQAVGYNYTGGPLQVRVEYFEQAGNASIDVHLARVGGGSGVVPEVGPPSSGGPTTGEACGPYAGSIAYVNVANLNFRDGPSTTFPIVRTLPECTAVELTGFRNPVNSNAGDWVQAVMLDDGTVAWAALRYLDTQVPVGSLTVLSD